MQIRREPLCFSHFSNILLCKFQLPQQSRTRFSSSQFIETAVSNGLPLPGTEGRNRDYCGAYFVCFPFLKDYNSASFGWCIINLVKTFSLRNFPCVYLDLKDYAFKVLPWIVLTPNIYLPNSLTSFKPFLNYYFLMKLTLTTLF